MNSTLYIVCIGPKQYSVKSIDDMNNLKEVTKACGIKLSLIGAEKVSTNSFKELIKKFRPKIIISQITLKKMKNKPTETIPLKTKKILRALTPNNRRVLLQENYSLRTYPYGYTSK